MSIEFKIGDSVVVKKGVTDPDSGIDISGWQGRIIEIDEESDEEVLILIAWDSVTLKNIPESYLEESEKEGLDWTSMNLYASEVEPTQNRDTPEDVEKASDEVSNTVQWLYLDEEGKRIQKILNGIDRRDMMGQLDAWEEYMEENLSFPFEAKISPDADERGPLRVGEKVKVLNIEDVDDLYGIIVALRRGREKFHFPLCDLTAISENPSTNQLVYDYVVWFANR